MVRILLVNFILIFNSIPILILVISPTKFPLPRCGLLDFQYHNPKRRKSLLRQNLLLYHSALFIILKECWESRKWPRIQCRN